VYSYDRRRTAGVVRARWISGSERSDYRDQIWALYEASYAKIGLAIPGPQGLMRYENWEVAFDGDTPIAFNVYRNTPAGRKAGALGTDGSSAAKSWIKKHLKTRFKQHNIYAEVSDAVEHLSRGVPVVCAIHVPKVLDKPVIPQADGIHYKRNIQGVGWHIKKLIGNPKGGLSGPEGSCPIPEHPGEKLEPREVVMASVDDADSWMEAAEHAACQYA